MPQTPIWGPPGEPKSVENAPWNSPWKRVSNIALTDAKVDSKEHPKSHGSRLKRRPDTGFKKDDGKVPKWTPLTLGNEAIVQEGLQKSHFRTVTEKLRKLL